MIAAHYICLGWSLLEQCSSLHVMCWWFVHMRCLQLTTFIWDNTSAVVSALLFRPERIFVESWRVLF